MNNNKKIKLIIIEDHALTRIGLKTAFQESPNLEIVGESEFGETGIDLTKNLNPDVVIVDLGLPNMNGIEVIRAIKNYNSSIKTLVLTSHDNEEEVIEAFKAGTDAYCTKDINPSRLISVIEGIIDGGIWLDSSIARIILNRVIMYEKFADKSNKTTKSDPCPLTDRELEVLQLLADSLSSVEIGKKLSVSQYTVKAHIGNILQKFSVDDRAQAIAKAMRQGWIR